jgi:hypothetical protein
MHEGIFDHQAKEKWNIFLEGVDPQYGESDKVVGKKIRASQFRRGIYFHPGVHLHCPRREQLGKFVLDLPVPMLGKETIGKFHL